MIEEHGASIVYLAGERSVLSCKARKAEIVQPRKLPDGLLEARLAGRSEPSLVFGPVGSEITAGLAQLKEKEKIMRLSLHAANCTSLQDFEQRLREELPASTPASTRGKRRPRKPLLGHCQT